MQNNFVKICKATIIDIIVALLFAGIIILVINLVAGKQINSVISLINMISVEEKEESQEEIVLSQEKKRLENYPAYGSKYGRVEIESLKIDLPLYHGDTDKEVNQ